MTNPHTHIAHGLPIVSGSQNSWSSVVESLPAHDQDVLVAMLAETGEQWVMEARFKERSTHSLLPAEREEFESQGPDGMALIELMDEAMAELENRNAYFQMAGGDWDAEFYFPQFSRRGMDYVERQNSPIVIITHWRLYPDVPEFDTGAVMAKWKATHQG